MTGNQAHRQIKALNRRRVAYHLPTVGVLIAILSVPSCSWFNGSNHRNVKTLVSEIERVESLIETKREISEEDLQGADSLELSRLEREKEILLRLKSSKAYSIQKLKDYKDGLKSRAQELHEAIPVQQEKLQAMEDTGEAHAPSEIHGPSRAPASEPLVEAGELPESAKHSTQKIEEELYQMLMELGRINHEFMVIDRLLMLYKSA